MRSGQQIAANVMEFIGKFNLDHPVIPEHTALPRLAAADCALS
jgi:hypothetical protein